MQVGCIIQARLGGTRFPGKVLEDIGGWPMIRHVWERMNKVGIPVVVATPMGEVFPSNIPTMPIDCDPEDVLQRYLIAALTSGFDTIMRVTGDCPLIDPDECSRVLKVFRSGQYSYVANDWQKLTSVPDGLGCEVFTRSMLQRANIHAKTPHQREHVTPWIKQQCWAERTGLHLECHRVLENPPKLSVDTLEDLQLVREIDAHLVEGHLKYAMDTTLAASDKIQNS